MTLSESYKNPKDNHLGSADYRKSWKPNTAIVENACEHVTQNANIRNVSQLGFCLIPAKESLKALGMIEPNIIPWLPSYREYVSINLKSDLAIC